MLSYINYDNIDTPKLTPAHKLLSKVFPQALCRTRNHYVCAVFDGEAFFRSVPKHPSDAVENK